MSETNELTVEQLRRYCSPDDFEFSSTEDLPALGEVVGQDRALRSISFGIDIRSYGYHIYALGPVGTGKTTTISKFLKKDAAEQAKPDDWLYVNNFDDPDKPKALRLPGGEGRQFKERMDQLVEELTTEVPRAFERKEYQEEREKIEQEFQQKGRDLFQELNEEARERGFTLMQTPQGLAVVPTSEGEVMSPDQLNELSDEKREEIEKAREDLQGRMRETMRRAEQIQKEGKERARELDRRTVGFAVDHLINDLKEQYSDYEAVTEFLSRVKESLLDNVQAFKQIKQMEEAGQQQKAAMSMMAGQQQPSFDEYRVNLIVDNSQTEGAPVIHEKNPIGPNLIGRIEHEGKFGALVTNFRMIKGGSLHEANGGYLMVDAFEVLTKPLAWQVLKRAIKNREVVIESMGQAYGMLTTRTLEPEPIPLDTKVVLVGHPYIYYLLYHLDSDFQELFKVKADFGTQMDWAEDTPEKYGQFIGTVCREEGLKHFEPSGVAKVVEYGARLVSHQQKLATKFGDIVDLVRQAAYWAGKNGNGLVKGEDVQRAIEEKTYRSNRVEERIQEMIEEGTILIDTDGSVTGQVNGISVMPLGDYAFGKPSRITARTYAGSGGVVNIDREAKLGGPLHNKGAMILTGYLGGRYANETPLALSASIAFEQLYEEIEGDSAASAELYGLLSSLSGYPLRQDLAVTGSVNQRGEVQAIGGVNEKIEGFFHVCRSQGLTGNQGVIIPEKNLKHLMLKEYVVDAVREGKFHIYAVSTVDQGMELLTGKEAGERRDDGTYPENTVNAAVQKRITELAEKAREFGRRKEES